MPTRNMTIAKADRDDIDLLKKYLMRNEAKSSKFSRTFPIGWRRVIWAADILIENCCDPTEDHLAYSPYLNEVHVAPEQ